MATQTKKTRYYARQDIMVGGSEFIRFNKPIPDGRFTEEQLKSMVKSGIVGVVDSAPPPPKGPIELGEKSFPKGVSLDHQTPYQALPYHRAISPKTIEGLDIDALNEQAVAAGWDGEPFTDTLAASDYLSRNFRTAEVAPASGDVSSQD